MNSGVANLEQVTVTHEQDINALQAVVSDLEGAVVGNVNLSLLLINTDKDWLGYSITNIGSLSVNNDISVGGTVDGIDIAGHEHDGTISGGQRVSLSNVLIDANKDMNGKALTNLSSIEGTGNAKFARLISRAKPIISAYTEPSDTIQWAKDSWSEISNENYRTIKSFRSCVAISGYRVIADLKNNTGTSYAQLWKNGEAIGSEITINSTSFVTKDLGSFYGLLPGDLLEIKVRAGTGNWVYCINARVCFTVTEATTEFI